VGLRALPLPAEGTAAADSCAELARLVDHFGQSLFRYLVVLLGDGDTAGDCMQDTFLRAYEHLRRGKTISSQWLYTVARNRAIDELRRRKRERVDAAPFEWQAAGDLAPSDRTRAVERALRELSREDQEVLYLAEVDGFTSKQIGEMLGVRPGAVRMRLMRAHLRFRAAYGAEP
jgi:RNA polymerase sigma-70 factor (ECF subfamily)